MRKASLRRTTKETDVEVAVDLDGTGAAEIATGIGFFDHMLELLARHARIDLTVKAKGDLHIDHHHTTEDVGIALGQAVKRALGEMKGITRYAYGASADGRGAHPRRARHFRAAVPGVQSRVRPRQGRRASIPSWSRNGSRPSRSTPASRCTSRRCTARTTTTSPSPASRVWLARSVQRWRSIRARPARCPRPRAAWVRMHDCHPGRAGDPRIPGSMINRWTGVHGRRIARLQVGYCRLGQFKRRSRVNPRSVARPG